MQLLTHGQWWSNVCRKQSVSTITNMFDWFETIIPRHNCCKWSSESILEAGRICTWHTISFSQWSHWFPHSCKEEPGNHPQHLHRLELLEKRKHGWKDPKSIIRLINFSHLWSSKVRSRNTSPYPLVWCPDPCTLSCWSSWAQTVWWQPGWRWQTTDLSQADTTALRWKKIGHFPLYQISTRIELSETSFHNSLKIIRTAH